ncbi:hypothetical protein [Streptomyces sp. NPDC058751]|uniref:hypothetical protein n=1 Tax=Streptomyces sp. NPDC058751 TaxID=3346623 RepID=UPI00368DF035
MVAVGVRQGLGAGGAVAGIVGTVAGLAALAVAVWALPPAAGGSGRSVRAHGPGAAAAGRDMTGNAFGGDSRTSTVTTAAHVPGEQSAADVSARGRGATAAGDDMRGNAFGQGSEAETR